MIIDSHAHYAHASFSNTFRYLAWEDTWPLKEGTREDLLAQMQEKGIAMSVEPGISLDFNENILALAERYPGRIFPAMGCHPTRCIYEKWSDRGRLDAYCTRPGVVAVGETGWIITIPDRSSSAGSNTCGFSISSIWPGSTACP